MKPYRLLLWEEQVQFWSCSYSKRQPIWFARQ